MKQFRKDLEAKWKAEKAAKGGNTSGQATPRGQQPTTDAAPAGPPTAEAKAAAKATMLDIQADVAVIQTFMSWTSVMIGILTMILIIGKIFGKEFLQTNNLLNIC